MMHFVTVCCSGSCAKQDRSHTFVMGKNEGIPLKSDLNILDLFLDEPVRCNLPSSVESNKV